MANKLIKEVRRRRFSHSETAAPSPTFPSRPSQDYPLTSPATHKRTSSANTPLPSHCPLPTLDRSFHSRHFDPSIAATLIHHPQPPSRSGLSCPSPGNPPNAPMFPQMLPLTLPPMSNHPTSPHFPPSLCRLHPRSIRAPHLDCFALPPLLPNLTIRSTGAHLGAGGVRIGHPRPPFRRPNYC